MIQEELLTLLRNKQYGAVKTLVQDMNEVDVAEAIEEIFEENEEPETLLRLFRLLPKETAAESASSAPIRRHFSPFRCRKKSSSIPTRKRNFSG